MSGASMNDIKARIKSVQSTMQITKAMELVASSKLRRAKERAERSRPFYEAQRAAIATLQSSGELTNSPFCTGNENLPTLYVVIAGDRGLAGGYNANVFRLVASLAKDGDTYLPVGKKALDYYRHRKMPTLSERYEYTAEVSVGGCLAMARKICRAFLDGRFGRVVLVYTHFTSMLTQTPKYETVLPLCPCEFEGEALGNPIIEGDLEEMMLEVVPEYVGGVLYCAVCESVASESGARRSAMSSANKNAGEIIDTLTLKYNRARQAVITQEITEIVSGAEALG